MGGIVEFIRKLFSSSPGAASEMEPSAELPDGENIIVGTDSKPGVATVRDDLADWKAGYAEDYEDYLTVKEALKTYQRAQEVLDRLEPIHENPGHYDENTVDAARTLRADIAEVLEFVEARDAYNEEWLGIMKASHGDELNSYFDDGIEHTDQQFRAIFSNDNYNRVNAAAGTGKTTTFGRRVNFILSEYDDVAASDLLAVTFTRNGVSEMEKELEETFGITGVEVSTINSYSKSVAEDQFPKLEFIVDEAKKSEIASIWRSIRTSETHEDTYDEFFDVWKDSKYDPNNFEVVEGVYNRFTKQSGTTVGGEEVEMDPVPEEGLAHEAIARFLMEHQLEYDYQVHLDWAHSASSGYVLDFQLVDAPATETIYIEYCTSEATRENRPGYRNSNSERPETVRRIFEPNEHLDTDVSDRTGIAIDGEALLDRPSDETDWDDDRVRDRFRTAVRSALAEELQATSLDLGRALSGESFMEYVYDRKVLSRDAVETVGEFISQARVREWDPNRARAEVSDYTESVDDIGDGIPEFCDLCLAAYKQFDEVFDNETKTDFHGSVVLTRDLFEAGEVDDRFLYQYVFIDEMQDLNQVQFDAVRALAEQLDDIRVFGVGDDWQSIFGFQGARPDLFINYGNVLGASDYDGLPDPASVFTDDNPLLSDYEAFADTRLEDNFRCPDTVVAASNAVIRNNEVRTEKNPTGLSGGTQINVHHLGCDTYEYKRNMSMQRRTERLVRVSDYPLEDIQVLLRKRDGDPKFYYGLKNALPGAVDIRTAHNAKGSEAKHVIVPKVSDPGGYPSVNPEPWLVPVKQPPSIYEDEDAIYQLEEERRLFYVALTRAESRLDVLTVQGAESVFIEELPDKLCEHRRPLSEAELEEIETDYECRKTVTGSVDKKISENYATVEWDGRGIIDLNLFDATDAQIRRIEELAADGGKTHFQNCGIQYRSPPNEDDADYKRLQLQLDEDVTIDS